MCHALPKQLHIYSNIIYLSCKINLTLCQVPEQEWFLNFIHVLNENVSVWEN